MPNYAGRLGSRTQTLLFGGINSEASIANIRDGEAQDITNWDLLPGGAIQVRSGYTLQRALGGPGRNLFHYTLYSGLESYIAVTGGKVYGTDNPTGVWTDQTPASGFVDSTNAWVGTNFGNNFYLANKDNQPLYIAHGAQAVALKTQSLVAGPTNQTCTPVGATGTTLWKYAITTLTGRGESLPVYTQTVSGNATLSSTSYNLLTWTPVTGDNGGYNIYRWNDTDQAYELIGQAVSQASLFQDTGEPYTVPTQNPPVASTAYNTPADWDTNGYPEGFGVLSRGAGGRLIAWRQNTVWVSGLNNPLDWYGSGAFTFYLDGAVDNRIRACFAIYDFTVFTSSTNSFFVAGNSSSNLEVVKIQGTGCVSPNSAVQVGNDVYIWSQFGPTSLQRVLQGQDVQYAPIAEKIKSLIPQISNVNQWPLIAGFNDVFNRRVVWLFPGTGATANTDAFVFYYNTGGWTRYTNYPFVNAVVTDDNQSVYGLSSGGSIYLLNSGTTDAGTAVTATYNGPWYDMGNWDMRRVLWQDLLVDSSPAPFNFTVTVSWDWGRSGYSETHTITDSTMDGLTIPWTGTYANFYRVPTQGVGQSIQYSFTATGSTNPPRIIGWRLEGRAKGARVS